MNCETFHDLLPEYLDESLETARQSEAQQHLEQCAVCRDVLRREQAMTKVLHRTFDFATAGISLPPQMHQKVLRASASPAAALHSWRQAWQKFLSAGQRPIGAVTMLAAAALLVVNLITHRPTAKDSTRETVEDSGPRTWVITVPLLTEKHIYRQQNGTIEDAVVPGDSVAFATFTDNLK